MKKTRLILPALVILLGAGSLFASNMGFKLVYQLHATAGSTGTNWVSLPYYWSGTTAADVCNDITGATEIGMYNESTDLFSTWTCGGKGTPFSLTPGEAVIARAPDLTNWTLVGSHNPALAITLYATAGTTGTNWVSVPYHTSATTAASICTEIPTATEVGKYNESTDLFSTWTCGGKGTPFSLTVGEGIIVRAPNLTTWTPAHY